MTPEVPMPLPRKRSGLRVREIDGETVILDEARGHMHNLNITASFIFDQVNGERTIDEISRDLANAFGIPRETADQDTKAFLELLRLREILE